MRSIFRRRRHFPPCQSDTEQKREAEAAKAEAQDNRDRVSALSATVKNEVEALREDRYRNHYAEAIAEALYRRNETA